MIQLALTAFGVAGWGTRLAILGSLAAAVTIAGGIAYHHIWSNGYDRALIDIASQDAKAVASATAYRGVWKQCDVAGGMRWDQTTGQCRKR